MFVHQAAGAQHFADFGEEFLPRIFREQARVLFLQVNVAVIAALRFRYTWHSFRDEPTWGGHAHRRSKHFRGVYRHPRPLPVRSCSLQLLVKVNSEGIVGLGVPQLVGTHDRR